MEQKIDFNKLLGAIAAKLRTGDDINEHRLITQEEFKKVAPGNFELSSNDAYRLQRMIIQAALSGWFAPGELDDLPLDNSRVLLLQQLYRYCRTNNNQPQRWWLEKDIRISVLDELIRHEELLPALQRPLPQTDETGLYIRQILNHQAADFTNTDIKALLNYSMALEALDGLQMEKPDLFTLRKKIEKENFLIQQGILDLQFFIGRKNELRILDQFAVDEDGFSEWRGVILTGAGGAGKSALLNKFHAELFKREDVGTALIDFDRPGMDPRDTLWLETEIIKQIGLQFGIGDKFEIDRNEVWSDKLNASADYSDEQSESAKRLYRNLLYRFRRYYLEDNINAPRCWVLILDTFEEVIQRGLAIRIMDWLTDLQSVLEPIRFRVVFSGRLFDETERVFPAGVIRRRIRLDEFDTINSEHFLERMEVHPLVIQRLLRNRSIPKRPLELKLLAQLFHQEGEAGIRQLERDLANGGSNSKLYAGIIYRRVLLRLNRKELRQMAYPGLILRYLTTELIVEVLAPVLNMQGMNYSKADRILHDLANYGWLAYISKERLWHRKDLRRAILQVMIANDPETALTLHKSAVAFFQRNYNSANLIEVFYHQMMIGDFDDFPSYEKELELKTIEAELQSDILDFPKRSKIIFDLLWRKIITRQNLEQLPERYQPVAFNVLGNNYIETEQYNRALNLLGLVRRKQVDLPPSDDGKRDWQEEALFQTVNWKELSSLKRQMYIRGPWSELNMLLIYLVTRESYSPNIVGDFKSYIRSSDFLNLLERDHKRINDMVGRLTICVMIMKAAGGVNKESPEDILNIVRFLRDISVRNSRPDVYRLTLLLELCAGQKRFPNYLMIPYFAKLDLAWLDNRTNYTSSDRVKENLGFLAQILDDFSDRLSGWDQKRTPRALLSAVDRGNRYLHNDNSGFPAIDPPRSFDDIKGPFPEIRNMVKYALLQEFSGAKGIDDLRHLLMMIIPFELDTFEPMEFFETFRRRGERELGLYIELIDRMWKLQELILKAIELRPYSEKLDVVNLLCSGWYAAYRKVWEETY